MNKFKKVFLSLALVFVALITLASCSQISKSYADKINSAAKTDNPITYDDAKNALGKECSDWTLGGNGVMFAIKGYQLDSKEDFDKLMDESSKDKKYEVIIILCVNKKCTKASFVSGTSDEIEKTLNDWVEGSIDIPSI